MKLITRLVFSVAALFLRPVSCCVQAAMVLALGLVILCGLFAFAVFLIDHKVAALQCTGDCILWVVLLVAANLAARYLKNYKFGFLFIKRQIVAGRAKRR